MTRDDIIRKVREAGWSGVFVIEWAKQLDEHPVEKSLPVPVTMEQIERFAALVAAAERETIIQFLQEMQRAVGDAHNHYGVAAVRIKAGI